MEKIPPTTPPATESTAGLHLAEVIADYLRLRQREFSAESLSSLLVSLSLTTAMSADKASTPLGRLLADKDGNLPPDAKFCGHFLKTRAGIRVPLVMVCGDTAVTVTDRLRPSRQWARLYANITAQVAEAFSGEKVERVMIVYGETDNPSQRTVGLPERSIRDADEQQLGCHVITRGGSDLSLEVKRIDLARLTSRNRSRICRDMREKGINVLRGKDADIYLNPGHPRRLTDYVKLATLYPEAYAACVSEKPGQPFIRIKVNRTKDRDAQTPPEES